MLEIEFRTATAAPSEIASGPESLETAKLRLAFSVDLAAVVSLALVFRAQDLVGRIEFGKALSRLGIILVGIGVQLLGELTKCTLDCRCIRILLYPQHLIGVAHRESLRFSAGVQPRLFGHNVVLMRRLRNALFGLGLCCGLRGLPFSHSRKKGAGAAWKAVDSLHATAARA